MPNLPRVEASAHIVDDEVETNFLITSGDPAVLIDMTAQMIANTIRQACKHLLQHGLNPQALTALIQVYLKEPPASEGYQELTLDEEPPHA